MTVDRFRRIRQSPALYPGVADTLGPAFPWHTHAGSARSSQALCLSVWVPLAGLAERDAVVSDLLSAAFPGLLPARPRRRWQIAVEVTDPAPGAGRPASSTRIDVLLDAGSAVIALESKYLGDALQGVGRCERYPTSCLGIHDRRRRMPTDTGSRRPAPDPGGPTRLCRAAAERLLRPGLDEGPGGAPRCTPARYHQLVRTLFFAAEAARHREEALRLPRRSAFYAALVMAPAATAGLLERQVAELRSELLLPEHAARAGLLHYESLADALLEHGGEAAAVGRFLAAKLAAAGPAAASATAAGPRHETVRELRRRAERARKRR